MSGIPLMDSMLAAFFRLAPLLILFPVPGLDRLPAFVRVFFCLALSVVLAGSLPVTDTAPVTAWLTHFLLGAALALGVHACFAGMHIGSQLVDAQAGTNATSIFNPAHAGTGIFSEIFMLAVAITVLLSDTVLVLLGKSLAITPDMSRQLLTETHFIAFLQAIGKNMAAGFLLTFPLIAGLWLIDVLAAASSRLLPQSNIYFLFLPVKTLFAMLLFIAYASALLSAADLIVHEAMAA